MPIKTKHLYVHIPFCTRRCSYCDFAIAVRREVPVAHFIDCVLAELTARAKHSDLSQVSTIYLGGGTPSKLGADGITSLLDRIRSHPGIGLMEGAELTMEANPEDLNREVATSWRAAGITRLSLGVQSFDPKVLTWMHRTHSPEAAGLAVAAARAAGIDDISVDLIFALPGELERSWSNDLERALELGPSHVSLYGLTVEPHTPLGRWTARGEVAEAPEERYAAEFLEAHEAMTGAGYEHYEVSNFGLLGHRSQHNSSYWQRVPYLGLGPSAHSFDGERRRWNDREYSAWAARVANGDDPMSGDEILGADQRLAEEVYLGLRTIDGLEIEPADAKAVAQWTAAGWAGIGSTPPEAPSALQSLPPEPRSDRLILTPEGWLRLDSLAAALSAVRSR